MGHRRFVVRRAFKKLHCLHRNEQGSISIVSVFAFLILAMLLGMLINVGRNADRKVKMQDAADASAYSGTVTLARSMNTLAFANQLLCEVFAKTAELRALQDVKDAEPSALLAQLEKILAEHLITDFQRAIVDATPQMAAATTDEIAGRHGRFGSGWGADQPMRGVLWKTDVTAIGITNLRGLAVLPVVDPNADSLDADAQLKRKAQNDRRSFAYLYLAQAGSSLDRKVQEELERLLEVEYADRNLPFVLRDASGTEEDSDNEAAADFCDTNEQLERDFMFVGVAYGKAVPQRLPGLYRGQRHDDVAFAQVRLFLPRPRLRQQPGNAPHRVFRTDDPTHRDLMNQNWTVQLVPATASSIPDILQTNPPIANLQAPNLGGISIEQFRRLNTH